MKLCAKIITELKNLSAASRTVAAATGVTGMTGVVAGGVSVASHR